MSGMTGGEGLAKALQGQQEKYANKPLVKVGFFSKSDYADGTSLPMVAMLNEYGGTINVPVHQVTIYKRKNKAGTKFTRKGRFVKKSQSNFNSTHMVPAHTITIPPRPFFRNMIAKNKTSWGPSLAILLKQGKSPNEALALMGELIRGQLQISIVQTNTPKNAASTIRNKGFDNPLIHTRHMFQSVEYEVVESS